MTITGYSDRINHAFAFAAKHHDQQVRKGTRLPYLTHPANLAVILTRYGQDEETVVAGILHDVIEDCVRDGYTAEMLDERIAEKFGTSVLQTLLQVTERRHDEEGVELSADDRRDEFLARLAAAGTPARWVCAADLTHTGSALLTDLRRTSYPETVWSRFAAGRDGTVRWYRLVYERLREVGFDAPIMTELGDVVTALEGAARVPDEPGRRR